MPNSNKYLLPIPHDIVQAIVQQVLVTVYEAINSQAKLAKQQLVCTMATRLNEALNNFINTTKAKLDEINHMQDDH